MNKIFPAILFLAFILPGVLPSSTEENLTFVYQSPRPEARFTPPETVIALRSTEEIDPASITDSLFTVLGSLSGQHTGKIILADDHATVIFKPDRPFQAGETVRTDVLSSLRSINGKTIDGTSFNFYVGPSRGKKQVDLFSSLLPETKKADIARPQMPQTVQVGPIYHTVPADFPIITVTVPASETADGYIFLANFNFIDFQSHPYLLILNDNGGPVYYQHLQDGSFYTDFKKQSNGFLTYFNGPDYSYHVLDSSYHLVDTISAQNGYVTDIHELQILPNGHSLLMIYDPQTIDMTLYGGLPDASVVGLVIQELDPSKNVVFQWRSWDYLDQIEYTDSYASLTGPSVDYIHGNAIQMDYDGNLLISSRHLSTVFKINRVNGDIMWRLGGKKNEFDFGGDEGFSYQHDIRRLANGDISLFDNNNLGSEPHYSRGVEYEIDEYAKTVRQTWQFRNTPDVYSSAMGNMQRLPNGNTVIGWGSSIATTVTEVKPDGDKALEMVLGNNNYSYRAFRFPWEGHPITSPDLVMEQGSGTTTLYYSWNGATNVAQYKVFGGVSPNEMNLLIMQEKTGFETSTDITPWANDYCFFQVIPVDEIDTELQSSNPIFIPNQVCHLMFMPITFGQN